MGPWASLLRYLDLHIEDALCITGEKVGQNRGRDRRILTPNESIVTFWASNVCAKLHQNRKKIATVGARTDRQTEGRK